MEKIVNFISRHVKALFISLLLLFIMQLILVHILFKWNSNIEFLSAEWTAGDFLTYLAGFEAFFGTVFLGAVSIYQTEMANQTNKKLSTENNFLQKINVQKLLPIICIESLLIEQARKVAYVYKKEKEKTIEVGEAVTPQNRVTHIKTYLPLIGNCEFQYQKTLKLTIKNISDSPISQIYINRIEFPEIRDGDSCAEKVICYGDDKKNHTDFLLFPGKTKDILLEIQFDNEFYKNFWEYASGNEVGRFDIYVYITNISLSGVKYREQICLSKANGFAEQIVYKAGEESII